MPVEHRQQPVGIGSAVEQHPTAAWALDEDGVSLADIEHGDGETTRTLTVPPRTTPRLATMTSTATPTAAAARGHHRPDDPDTAQVGPR